MKNNNAKNCFLKRDIHGRFIVNIHLNSSPTIWENQSKMHSVNVCHSRSVSSKIQNSKVCTYVDFMSEYETLCHMLEVNSSKSFKGTQYFIPHHGLYKEESLTTNKLRVVFNSSAPSSTGISLNDIKLNEPVLQDYLFSILIRFRIYK